MSAVVEDVIREIPSNPSMIGQLNKSEIDQQIATAHAYPRSIKQFHSECLDLVCLSESVAQDCIYALPRGNKVIEGPSARFAEIIANSWGNCRAGARVVEEGAQFITAQGVFHDLEKNVAITYEVKRRITDKHGKRFKDDMIGVTANAACSIALRNAILKGVPKALWNNVYSTAKTTAVGDIKTLVNRREDALQILQHYGATPEIVCNTLDVAGVEDIGLEELATLKGLVTAIKEGDTTPEQAFNLSSENTSSAKPAALPPYPDEKFATDLDEWKAAVIGKKKTPKDILNTVRSKYALTEIQENEIHALGELV